MQGLRGEHTFDDSVWIYKSHSPLHMPGNPILKANKVIVIVRNPLDPLPSFLNMMGTGDHVTKPPFNYEEKYPKFWDWWVRFCLERMNLWYE